MIEPKTPELMRKLVPQVQPKEQYICSFSTNEHGSVSADVVLGEDLTEDQIYEQYKMGAIRTTVELIAYPEVGLVENAINDLIQRHKVDTNKISDGYHTFGELYEHRCILYLLAAKSVMLRYVVWRSKYHSDGTDYPGWFILGIGFDWGNQITYHLPMSLWELSSFAVDYPAAPAWDNHTSADVLERLKKLL